MAIINRIQKILQADIHAALDSIEDPETMLKQALREMETAIAERKERVEDTKKIISVLRSDQRSLMHLIEQTEEDIKLCFAHNKEALLHKSVRQKLELSRRCELVHQQIERMQHALQGQEQSLEKDKKDFAVVAEESRVLLARNAELRSIKNAKRILRDANQPGAIVDAGSALVTDSDVELEIIRLQSISSEKVKP